MIITVVPVRMVQVPVDQVINVIPVRHRWMTTIRSVAVAFLMPATVILRRATSRIGLGHLDVVFIDVPRVRVVEMAVVQIVDMTVVFDRQVPAAGSVLMRMIGVSLALIHRSFLTLGDLCRRQPSQAGILCQSFLPRARDHLRGQLVCRKPPATLRDASPIGPRRNSLEDLHWWRNLALNPVWGETVAIRTGGRESDVIEHDPLGTAILQFGVNSDPAWGTGQHTMTSSHGSYRVHLRIERS